MGKINDDYCARGFNHVYDIKRLPNVIYRLIGIAQFKLYIYMLTMTWQGLYSKMEQNNEWLQKLIINTKSVTKEIN